MSQRFFISLASAAVGLVVIGTARHRSDASHPRQRSEAQQQDLRDRIANLEQQVRTERDDSRTKRLQDLVDQISAIREQRAEEQAPRATAAEAAQETAVRTEYAVEALSSAYHRLEYGDSDVLDALDYARPALPYPAQLALDNARGAIQSEDLAAARYWISLAIVETLRYQNDR